MIKRPHIQDLMEVIKAAGLKDALSHTVMLLEFVITMSVRSVHYKRVISKLKGIMLPVRSRMLLHSLSS